MTLDLLASTMIFMFNASVHKIGRVKMVVEPEQRCHD